MKALIIYDNEGYILSQRSGQPSPRVPVGVPYLLVEIPEGKQIKKFVNNEVVPQVDVTKTPHEVILEDIPPTEIDVLRSEITELKQSIDIMLGDEDNE